MIIITLVLKTISKKINSRTHELEKQMKIILSQLNIKEVYERLDNIEKDLIKKGTKYEINELKDVIQTLEENEKDLNFKMERKEKKKRINTVKEIKEIKKHIEKEIREVCVELQNLLDKYLLPNNDDDDILVFLYKLKADYYRYICEFAEEDEFKENLSKAEEFYKKAYDISEKKLPVINCNRVSLALNYAIFLYEVKKDKKGGFDLAQNTFKENMKFYNDLEQPKYRDTLLIIQLLKENIIFWNSEMSDEE